jgi:signal transduction histidine kinase
MKGSRARRTVSPVKFGDLTPPSVDGPPQALRLIGWIAMATVLVSTVVADPKPGWSGEGVLVIAGIAGMASGLVLAARRHEWWPGARFIGLSLVGSASLLFAAVQPDSAGYAGVYFVMAIGGIRLSRDAAIIVCGGTIVGIVAISVIDHKNPAVVVGLLFSIVPWFLIMRLIRRLAQRRDQAERLVEELRESRAAHAESAALAERSRVARELHDVLAHSLSALALQLEGTRLLARDRGADAEVIDGAQLTVTGTPREASSEAQLALYRTAQEALTNVRRHSASERVDLKLDYGDDGTTLTVEDHGVAAPLLNGRSGYGLTGMRERAELLGGRLNAGPTDDGFRVELWLPA